MQGDVAVRNEGLKIGKLSVYREKSQLRKLGLKRLISELRVSESKRQSQDLMSPWEVIVLSEERLRELLC